MKELQDLLDLGSQLRRQMESLGLTVLEGMKGINGGMRSEML